MYRLSDISKSGNTVPSNMSDTMYNELKRNSMGWRYYSGKPIEPIAEAFINMHAALNSSLGYVYGPRPAFIIRSDRIEGLIYANGAVVLGRHNNYLEFWIAEDTAKLFRYPDPESFTN